MGIIIFASGQKDAMLRRRENPGANIVRFDKSAEDGGAAEAVRETIRDLMSDRTVIIPLEASSSTGWRAPEGTEVRITDAASAKYGPDLEMIKQAMMRSPKWAMTVAAQGPEFDPVIGDEPESAGKDPAPDQF